MGQKVNPIGLRIGLSQKWRSRWYAEGKKFAKFLEEDIKIREFIEQRLQRAAISKIEIERGNKSLSIEIYTARPGIVIGKAGAEVDRLKKDLEKNLRREVQISVKEIRRPELDAVLLAQNVAEQLVGRVPFRRAMKRAVTAAQKAGAKGVKIATAGRLGGHEMARSEWYREGRVPLHTLKADIDYGYACAKTNFGSIGVKVWIYRGDLIPGATREEEKEDLKKKLERIQAEKKAERKIEEEDIKKMEAAAKAEEKLVKGAVKEEQEKDKKVEKDKEDKKEKTKKKTKAKSSVKKKEVVPVGRQKKKNKKEKKTTKVKSTKKTKKKKTKKEEK